jgi:hypothetical protein
MSDWWKGVEAALESTSIEAPDPWAHLAGELPVLSDAQRSFLEQVATQPAVARLSIDDDDLPIDDEVNEPGEVGPDVLG